MRIGHGYDVHRLVQGRALILGGVNIPYEKGLLGHSDADVLTHAVMDALLGAAALGDIGKHFPDSDPAYKGADSLMLARDAIVAFGEKNGFYLTSQQLDAIKADIKTIKETHGKKLEEVLELNGYDSLKQLEEIRKLAESTNSIYTDMSQNMAKYIDKDMSVFNFKSAEDLIYYAKRTEKISLNQDLLHDFDIEIDFAKVYEADQKAAAEAETAEAEATDEEE